MRGTAKALPAPLQGVCGSRVLYDSSPFPLVVQQMAARVALNASCPLTTGRHARWPCRETAALRCRQRLSELVSPVGGCSGSWAHLGLMEEYQMDTRRLSQQHMSSVTVKPL